MDSESLFRSFIPYYIKHVQPNKLLTALWKEELLGVKEISTDVLRLQRNDRKESAKLLFTTILTSDDENRVNKMINAFKMSDEYEDLGQLLEGSADICDAQVFKLIVESYAGDLEVIDPKNILGDICNESFLSQNDRKQITDLNKGSQRGMLLLLKFIAAQKGWVTVFLEALTNNGYKSVCKKLERHIEETGIVVSKRNKVRQGTANSETSLSVQQVQCSTVDTGALREDNDLSGFAQDSDQEEEMIQLAIAMSTKEKERREDCENVDMDDSASKSPKETSSKKPKAKPMEANKLSPKQQRVDMDQDKPMNVVKPFFKSTDQPSLHTGSSDQPSLHTDSTEQPSLHTDSTEQPSLHTDSTEQPSLHTDSSDQPSLDELRRIRLERFGGTGTRSKTTEAGSSETAVKHSSNSNSQNIVSLIEETEVKKMDCQPDYKDADFELAKRLQEEEDLAAAKLYRGESSRGGLQWRDTHVARSLQIEEEEKLLNIAPPPAVDSDDDNGECTTLEKLELRSYQMELAEPAIHGANTLIVAPTGSGKTHVALAISKAHLESSSDDLSEEPKIAFIVPTVALVEQQKKQYKKYLSQCNGRNINIIGISGDTTTSQRMTLGIQVPQHDIFILTPQILVDALRKKEIPTIGRFTLIIFDECHHTMKDHSYNRVMQYYLDEKFCNTANTLPQIVGLTASVGVGKADKLEKAVTHVLTLCANLDCKIKTVKKEARTLDKHVNNPYEEIYEVPGRPVDPFKDTVSALMTQIQHKLTDEIGGEDDAEELLKKLRLPAAHGSEQYTQWVSSVEQLAVQMYQDDKRTACFSCVEYLKMYNNALLLNIDCQTQDAFDYIERKFETLQLQSEVHNWLKQHFTEVRENLKTVSQDRYGQYKNPKLEKLKQVMLRKYRENDDSRGIIFCKTRELTVALQQWITKDQDMSFLNPHNLVGSHVPENKGGMTQRRIENVLQYFKNGAHKLIIATTVAEEGLDISKCNLVIRYEHVTNETARIQAKGRGRAENACYILFCQRGGGIAEKESLNKMREQLMDQALSAVYNMDAELYRTQIVKLQKKAMIDRKMKKLGNRQKPLLQVGEVDCTLRCKACNAFACLGSDIRKIEGSHHIVNDLQFKHKVIVKPYPKPIAFKECRQLGKLQCRDCNAEWGMETAYNSIRFFVVAIKSFLIEDARNRRGNFKQWKDVPFTVPNLTMDELADFAPEISHDAEDWVHLEVQ